MPAMNDDAAPDAARPEAVPVVVVKDGCPGCHDLLEKHPAIKDAAVVLEISQQACDLRMPFSEERVCLTGEDVLEAGGATLVPYCSIVDRDGEVRECKPHEFEALKRGEVPAFKPKPRGREFRFRANDLSAAEGGGGARA